MFLRRLLGGRTASKTCPPYDGGELEESLLRLGLAVLEGGGWGVIEGNEKRLQRESKINGFFLLHQPAGGATRKKNSISSLIIFRKVDRFVLMSASGRHVRHEVKFVLAQPELGQLVGPVQTQFHHQRHENLLVHGVKVNNPACA